MVTRRVVLQACSLAAALAVGGRAVAARPRLTVYRDPGCGCCGKWIDLVRADGRYDVAVVQRGDVAAVKRRFAVPGDLWSCHTAIAAGAVFEGHVPLAAMDRFLRDRPPGLIGLAVAGMPAGSPGMEAAGRSDPYDVIAFGPRGPRLFARLGP